MVCVKGMAKPQRKGQRGGADEARVVVRHYTGCYPDYNVDEYQEGYDPEGRDGDATEEWRDRDVEAHLAGELEA